MQFYSKYISRYKIYHCQSYTGLYRSAIYQSQSYIGLQYITVSHTQAYIGLQYINISHISVCNICLQLAVATHARLIRGQLHRFSNILRSRQQHVYTSNHKKFQTPSSIYTQHIYTIQHIYISQHIYIPQSISQSSIEDLYLRLSLTQNSR